MRDFETLLIFLQFNSVYRLLKKYHALFVYKMKEDFTKRLFIAAIFGAPTLLRVALLTILMLKTTGLLNCYLRYRDTDSMDMSMKKMVLILHA